MCTHNVIPGLDVAVLALGGDIYLQQRTDLAQQAPEGGDIVQRRGLALAGLDMEVALHTVYLLALIPAPSLVRRPANAN